MAIKSKDATASKSDSKMEVFFFYSGKEKRLFTKYIKYKLNTDNTELDPKSIMSKFCYADDEARKEAEEVPEDVCEIFYNVPLMDGDGIWKAQAFVKNSLVGYIFCGYLVSSGNRKKWTFEEINSDEEKAQYRPLFSYYRRYMMQKENDAKAKKKAKTAEKKKRPADEKAAVKKKKIQTEENAAEKKKMQSEEVISEKRKSAASVVISQETVEKINKCIESGEEPAGFKICAVDNDFNTVKVYIKDMGFKIFCCKENFENDELIEIYPTAKAFTDMGLDYTVNIFDVDFEHDTNKVIKPCIVAKTLYDYYELRERGVLYAK
ncbi:MAG: hypothetical protein IJ736_02370 [Firmicutes bacterium]|nr:hypothetical protein [Bacillota bacterium]